MKYLWFGLLALSLMACSEKGPDAKLDRQKETLIDNEKNLFFYEYCIAYGKAINCVNSKREKYPFCFDEINRVAQYRERNIERITRFMTFTPDIAKRLSEARRKLESMHKKSTAKAFAEFFKAEFLFMVDHIQKNYYPQCREVAGLLQSGTNTIKKSQ